MPFTKLGLLQTEDALLDNLLTSAKSMGVEGHLEGPVVKYKPLVREKPLFHVDTPLPYYRLYLKIHGHFLLVKLRSSRESSDSHRLNSDDMYSNPHLTASQPCGLGITALCA